MIRERMHLKKRTGKTWVAVALGLSLGALGGCDSLLEVDLPASLTDEALNDPQGATTLVNSIIGQFETAWNRQVWDGHGRSAACEVILQSPGVEDPCEYVPEIDADLYDPLSISRSFAYTLHEKLVDDWDATDVPLRSQYLAISSIYAGASVAVMAEWLCEVTIDGGSLMTPDAAYGVAEGWLTTAISEVGSAGGDFALPHGIASSALELAYGLRSRVRWARGDNTGALADANQVTQGFTGWVTREAGLARRNLAAHHSYIIGYEKLFGIIDWWVGGNNPVTGQAWPNPLPFTGYLHLGVLPDGRAVRDDGVAIRLTTAPDNAVGKEATAVADTRVPFVEGITQGSSEPSAQSAKWTSESDNLPWVNWKEMQLIAAEAEGGQGAIDRVNIIRASDGLPLVTYADPGNAQQIRYMIIEERRRSLFLEGRYYATALLNPDVVWFPRATGNDLETAEGYGGGVKHVMPQDEYLLNENLGLGDRATGCAAVLRPSNFD